MEEVFVNDVKDRRCPFGRRTLMATRSTVGEFYCCRISDIESCTKTSASMNRGTAHTTASVSRHW